MRPRRITIHCTALSYGTLEGIRRYHTVELGWRDIGYHFVCTNGDPGRQRMDGVDRRPFFGRDGRVWEGRPLNQEGAGVFGHNADNIHYVLVGRPGIFSTTQLVETIKYVAGLCEEYEIPPAQVRGHNEFDRARSCPGLHMPLFRSALYTFRGVNPRPVV